MASMNDLWVKYDTLKKIMHILESKENAGEEVKGIAFTVALNDQANNYGQNVSAYVSQSKEQREANKEKFYIGNGKTFWSNGTQKTVKEMDVNKNESQSNDSDPF